MITYFYHGWRISYSPSRSVAKAWVAELDGFTMQAVSKRAIIRMIRLREKVDEQITNLVKKFF